MTLGKTTRSFLNANERDEFVNNVNKVIVFVFYYHATNGIKLSNDLRQHPCVISVSVGQKSSRA